MNKVNNDNPENSNIKSRSDDEIEALPTVLVRHNKHKDEFNSIRIHSSYINDRNNLYSLTNNKQKYLQNIVLRLLSLDIEVIPDKDFTFKLTKPVKVLKRLEGLYSIDKEKVLITIIGKDFDSNWIDKNKRFLQISPNKNIDLEDVESSNEKVIISVFNVYLKGSTITYLGDFQMIKCEKKENNEICIILERFERNA